MIWKLLRLLYNLSKAPSAARCEAVERRLDRLDSQSGTTRQMGSQTLVSRSVLRTIEAWKPPNGAAVQLIVCVRMGKRILFYPIETRESETNVVNQLDRLAYCLVVADGPELPDKWINELDIAWNLFEENITNGHR